MISRLAYAVGVGVALTRQRRDQVFTRELGEEAGFLKFRRMAVLILNNDAVSFVLLCLVTRNTLESPLSLPARLSLGVLLIFAGISVKYWAASCLGPGAYYWENFFIPKPMVALERPGPYRYLKNPMYTVGYLHAYGFALCCGSWIGLLAALFDQTAILIFNRLVEKPHFELLKQDTPKQYLERGS